MLRVVLAAVHRLLMVGVPCYATDTTGRIAFADLAHVFAEVAKSSAGKSEKG